MEPGLNHGRRLVIGEAPQRIDQHDQRIALNSRDNLPGQWIGKLARSRESPHLDCRNREPEVCGAVEGRQRRHYQLDDRPESCGIADVFTCDAP